MFNYAFFSKFIFLGIGASAVGMSYYSYNSFSNSKALSQEELVENLKAGDLVTKTEILPTSPVSPAPIPPAPTFPESPKPNSEEEVLPEAKNDEETEEKTNLLTESPKKEVLLRPDSGKPSDSKSSDGIKWNLDTLEEQLSSDHVNYLNRIMSSLFSEINSEINKKKKASKNIEKLSYFVLAKIIENFKKQNVKEFSGDNVQEFFEKLKKTIPSVIADCKKEAKTDISKLAIYSSLKNFPKYSDSKLES